MWHNPIHLFTVLIIVVLTFSLPGPKNVWIVGDSYIRRSEYHVRDTVGTNLGLHADIKWFGRGGLTWTSVLPILQQRIQSSTAPDILVIHCGGNDLGRTKSLQLVKSMKKDLHYLKKQFPEMKIIWSSINQRCHWRYGHPAKIEKARKFVNREMSHFCKNDIVHHPQILFNKPELFLKDNIHLSEKGNDEFWKAIAEHLKNHVFWIKARVKCNRCHCVFII